jgi:hypothetical protein
MAMSSDVEDNFLELGRTLRQLSDRDTDLFMQVINKSNIGRRKAYYLVEVSRTFDPLPVPRSRLKKIGWTKLQIIGKHVTPSNIEELLDLAEKTQSKELERQMRGEKPKDNAHCVLMYFSPKDFAELEKALVEHGATRIHNRRGAMQGKEEALLHLIRSRKNGGTKRAKANEAQ